MKQTEIAYYRKLKQLAKLVREDVDAEIVPLLKQLATDYVQDSEYKETYHLPVYGGMQIDGLPHVVFDAYWSGNFVWKDAWSDVIAAALQRLLARWTNSFSQRQSEQIAQEFVTTSAGDNDRRVKSFGIDLYGGDQQLQDYLRAAAFQNAQLIKSIPAQYLEQVGNIVMGNMRQGMRPSYIEGELIKQFGVTQRRAKLIARDQTAKIQGEMSRIRQVNSGLEYFKWVTSQDERVRHSHVAVAKRDVGYGEGVFKWSDLPVVDGVPTFPGQPINCRCIARPVTPAQVERNKARKV